MEAALRAAALEELALHPFPGISFERLCEILHQEKEFDLDLFTRAVLWRSLYCCHDVDFTLFSSFTTQQHSQPAAPAKAHANHGRLVTWRDPAVPPDLLGVPSTIYCNSEGINEAATRNTAGEPSATPADSSAATVAPDASLEQQKQWLLAACAEVPVRLLTATDLTSDRPDYERRVKDIPFQILRNISCHKENGQWQYRIAQELQMDPKTVFHHLKPLYRDELICHMQLSIPPTHKLGRRGGSTGGSNRSRAGSDFPAELHVLEGTISPSPGTPRTNLTMSALLWSSSFFSPVRLPAHLRGLVALQHLLPLQQQAVRLLLKAPNNILLEEEVKQFCISKILTSDEAPYLRFSDKQLHRLFYKLRESLERSNQVQRLSVRLRSAQIKVEEGTVTAAAEAANIPDVGNRKEDRGLSGTVMEVEDGDDDPSQVVDLDGVPLATLASLLLTAAGPEGLTTVELSRLLGLDIKRSGKALVEFSRRNLVSRVAERRGKCFLYRYISKDLPHFQALLSESPSADTASLNARVETEAHRESFDIALGLEEDGGGEKNRAGSAFLTASGYTGTPEVAKKEVSVYSAIVRIPSRTPWLRGQASFPTATESTAAAGGAAAAATEKAREKGAKEACYDRSARRQGGRHQQQDSTARCGISVGEDIGTVSGRKRPQSAEALYGDTEKRSRCRHELPRTLNEVERKHTAEASPAAIAAKCTAPSSPAVAAASNTLPSSADVAVECIELADAALPGAVSATAQGPGLAGDSALVTVVSSTSLSGAVERSASCNCITPASSDMDIQRVLREMKERAIREKLPPRTLRLLETPQFVARLVLFQQAVQSFGCCTIPSISKVIADAEKTPNGPDRKTVHRMAEVAMQLEPRIRRGRVAASKSSADRLEGPSGVSSTFADITFFFWAETLDEETAEQRVAALITQRRAHGCREAIRRNQLLLEGKLKEAGEELRLAGAPAAPVRVPELQTGSNDCLDISTAQLQVPTETQKLPASDLGTADSSTQSLVGKQLKGLEREISRLAELESRNAYNSVTQPGPPATAASLLMVDKTLPRASLQDKFAFSQRHLAFYGFIFPVMIRAKCFHQYLLTLTLQLLGLAGSFPAEGQEGARLTVSSMVRRMPLEMFLRLVRGGLLMASEGFAMISMDLFRASLKIGCGYALPLLDEHLAKDSASRQPLYKLPGLGKKNAGTAVRKLLSLLGRMGIVSQIEVAPEGKSEDRTSKAPPGAHAWRLNKVLRLPEFSAITAKDGEKPSVQVKEFDGLSHEGVESYWQQLQLQVSQWVLEERQMTWAMGSDSQPSQFFSPRSGAGEDLQQSDTEALAGHKATEDTHYSSRRRVQLPEVFPVAEAFNSKNWKGQVAFTGAARAAMDSFAAETLERLRDASGAELEAFVLNASSPQIVELSTRVGYPADAVLRYLIRVFEIKGGSRSNQTLLIGGSFGDRDEKFQVLEDRVPTASSQMPRQAAQHEVSITCPSTPGPFGNDSARIEGQARVLGTPAKTETTDRDRGPGLLVHRTRDVRFQCHRCGHFYSWEKSLRLHYERAHHESLPADEVLYVLPWERKRRLEDQQQKAELSKFRRRRRTAFPARDTPVDPLQLANSHDEEARKARERFEGRLLTRGSVKVVDVPASGFLLRASVDEEAILASMGREDEITLIGAAVVAERLWLAAYSPQNLSRGPMVQAEKLENRSGGPLSEAWLSPSPSQSLPSEEHPIWQILGCLCVPPLAPSRARLFLGFVLSRRSLNSRIFSSFRRLDPESLRHFVLEGRIPSALELRLHCGLRSEAPVVAKKSLVCRPLNSPRIMMARNMLKAVVFTPLPYYRPATQLAALRELRPLELSALWRAWQRKGWVTVFKPPSVPSLKEKKDAASAETAGKQLHVYKKPEIAVALEAKCRRPFVLSSAKAEFHLPAATFDFLAMRSSSRLSLFGRLWDYRVMSSLLHSTLELTPRKLASPLSSHGNSTPKGAASTGELAGRATACSSSAAARHIGSQGTDDLPHDIFLAQLAQEEGQTLEEGPALDESRGETNEGDFQLLQLLESARLQPPPSECLSIPGEPGEFSASAENKVAGELTGPVTAQLLADSESDAATVAGRVAVSLGPDVSGCEALAALEGLARGTLWLSPFWGKEGYLPDSPEAAADAELLKLLEEEDPLDAVREEDGLWNNVPEWLSAISLSRGDDSGEPLAEERPGRKPTEGGIETHITAHAAGVPEITAVTCSLLKSSIPRELRAAHATVRLAEPSLNPTEVPRSSQEEVGSISGIGRLCQELRLALEGGPAAPSRPTEPALQTAEHQEMHVRGAFRYPRRDTAELPPASHFADGIFGASGELDAFDASLLPPVLTDRTACAAASFGFLEETGNTEADADSLESVPRLLRPGLPGGFPVSLPTYADDYRQNWRFAAKAVEAFAPPGCLCNSTCGGRSQLKRMAESLDSPPNVMTKRDRTCVPVPPLAAFSNPTVILPQQALCSATEGEHKGDGPLKIFMNYLRGTSGPQNFPSKERGIRGRGSPPSGDYQLPAPLLEIVKGTARLALRIQMHELLPLLPTPPQAQAAQQLHEVAEKELAFCRVAVAATAAAVPAQSTTPDVQHAVDDDYKDMTVCVALALCPAWLLSCVLRAKVDGAAVPDLLLDLSRETAADPGAGSGREPVQLADLRTASCLYFRRAACKLGLGTNDEHTPRTHHRAPTRRPPSSIIGAAGDDQDLETKRFAAACASQLFLVSVSVLCSLRLVVPVPAGVSWRLVAAADAASHFCLREQPIVRDPLAVRWALHGASNEAIQAVESLPVADSSGLFPQSRETDEGGDNSCGGVVEPCGRCQEKGRTRPAMIPRAILAAWGSKSANSQCQVRQHEDGSVSSSPGADIKCGSHLIVGTVPHSHGEEGASEDSRQAEITSSFYSALLTWVDVGTERRSFSAANEPDNTASIETATVDEILTPMRLVEEWLPACAWVRLDGRLHASLVQLLCLRLWSLLIQRPGSTAQQLQGMLCLLDDCEVQFLLHTLVEEGIVTASLLWGPFAALCPKYVCRTKSSEFSATDGSGCIWLPRGEPIGGQRDPWLNDGKFAPTFQATDHASSEADWHALHVIDHILNVQAIYLPNAAAEVLPKFQPLLLPKLSRCKCGCSVLL